MPEVIGRASFLYLCLLTLLSSAGSLAADAIPDHAGNAESLVEQTSNSPSGKAPAKPTAEYVLFSLIQKRLSLMPDVAAYKWHHDLAIEDLEREAQILESTRIAAAEAGLKANHAREFFQQQMNAAKSIQQYWIDQWKAGAPLPDTPPDLKGDLRPLLNELSAQIIAQMKAIGSLAPSDTAWQQFQIQIQIDGLDTEVVKRLYQALVIATAPDSFGLLDRIRFTGRIRVATTGDYAPFSYLNSNGDVSGIDIDMANHLARALNAEIEWIPTSWPNLLQDLKEERFDIAMSGISVKDDRAAHGLFSTPYHEGGKTPIIRCADIKKYGSLADINQTGVRVIVNPGGTNHAFAKTRIDKAELRVFEDNRLIFDEIAEDRADAMITDAIEVSLQSSRDKRLCPAMPGKTLTHLQKAYLMPRDEPFLTRVNTWLESTIANGHLKQSMDHHLSVPSHAD
ncbi:MAG: gamma subclass chorismate mutase AroQ [Gammaproteobacteria bacterium]|nr:gamma subclass chorismate mutase AroQ [Gammaproteobacteria bacterium]